MGCGCGSSAKAAMKSVQTYEIENDPEQIRYLTERDAITQKEARELPGAVVASAK